MAACDPVVAADPEVATAHPPSHRRFSALPNRNLLLVFPIDFVVAGRKRRSALTRRRMSRRKRIEHAFPGEGQSRFAGSPLGPSCPRRPALLDLNDVYGYVTPKLAQRLGLLY
jgi:hypothetical protein